MRGCRRRGTWTAAAPSTQWLCDASKPDRRSVLLFLSCNVSERRIRRDLSVGPISALPARKTQLKIPYSPLA